MKVKVIDLKEGYRIIEDVKGLTKYPIVPKKTMVTEEIIKVLKAFSIEEVNVERVANRKINEKILEKKQWEKNSNRPLEIKDHRNSFFHQYVKAVESYKNQFTNWQAGTPININRVRQMMIPLIEALENHPIQLLLLQNYVKKSDYLFHHAVSTGLISAYIAKRLNLEKGDIIQITLAGCLSDCGMAKVNPEILQRETLTEEEKEEIKMHTTYSYKMVKNIPSLNAAAKLAVFQHHERLDGSGYPLGEKGDRIHLYAKIIAISDVYHAVVCDRVYKEKKSPFQALEILNYEQIGQFDLKIVKTFTSSIISFSLNEYVKLSNGQTARVIYIHHHDPTRPVVKIEESGEIISLGKNKELYIKEIIQ
ncbi:HD-GYP domain-containing protein [Fervidibacillus halotolerans]|uniref:HD domain-containing protein n=1 Tax=Fervidibacillus halotolerans TaxID=2980027 RepID=A0A9E8LZ87_9BACI|nr:HD domain-containing phosphohydrolase [Fervidibacillus halotolerans]WAA12304.1 HD domain-containing protein [Fervidibacillus halotolerans]